MSSMVNSGGDNNNIEIPQWKKDLIARLRNQNRRTASCCGGILIERHQQQQQQQRSPQSSASMVAVITAESSTPSSSSSSTSVQQHNQFESVRCSSSSKKKKKNSEYIDVIESCKKMVQDSVIYDNNCENFENHQYKHHHQYKNGDHSSCDDDNNDDDDEENNDSDKNSIDDLHYGPGIVNKLKNKYLSLVLRESNNNSNNIKRLPMRKAASLENILDDCHDADDDDDKYEEINGKLSNNHSNNTENLYKKFNTNNKNEINKVNCRYRKMTRGNDNNKKIIVKRARSVETISRHNHEINDVGNQQQPQQQHNKQRESMPEEILINFNNNQELLVEKCGDNNYKSSSSSSSTMATPRINRPKRIQPVVNEKEKPPVDFVKQTKLIFERHRPELYKKSSSIGNNNNNNNNNNEVAAKVANYKNIIVNNNKNNKPPIKQKPVLLKINEKSIRKLKHHHNDDDSDRKVITTITTTTPPPDVSQLSDIKTNQLSSDTPDLIITTSPVLSSPPSSSSPISVLYHLKQTTEDFIKEEIRNNYNNHPLEFASIKGNHVRNQKLPPPPPPPALDEDEAKDLTEKSEDDCGDGGSYLKKVPPQAMINIDKVSTTITYNFVKTNKIKENNLPTTTADTNEKKIPINQPLKLDTTITTTTITSTASPKIIEKINKLVSPPLRSSASSKAPPPPPPPVLTMLEIEKNMKNTVKTLEQPKSILSISNNNDNNSVNCLQKVPKLVKRKPSSKQQSDNNSIVFKFTDRKDVPDYLHHDGLIRVGKIERPKVGEGGIILLPGASIEESFTDDYAGNDDDDVDEIMRSLEAPPSPCDVTFINDNILIDGKSSLITQKKTRKNNSSSSKLKISFVEDGPEVYEYPSESSFSIEEVVKQPQQQQISGHTTVLPSLSGSSLGNYTPKGTEEFHPGVTRTSPITSSSSDENKLSCKNNDNNSSNNETILQETEKPIVFSAGTNSDILF